VPDRALVELARRRPSGRAALEEGRGLPERIRAADVDGMLEAIREGAAAEPIPLPPAPSPEAQARLDVLAPLGAVLVTARAAGADLAPSLLATRDEIASFLLGVIRGDADGHPLASGWRHDLAGGALEDLARGRLALAADPRRPYLAEIDRGGE
jgi:ribonuclease D